jgi:hypothetical protein
VPRTLARPRRPSAETGREEERAEREERRGLEARAGALLAAGAAVVGLLATALSNVNVPGVERDRILLLFVTGTAIMLGALALVAVALNRGMTRRVEGEPHLAYAGRIRHNNETMVKLLGPATLIFAVSVATFLAALIWAAYASSPPRKAAVTVVVKSEPGRVGPRGPHGPKGARGPQGPPGPPPEQPVPEGS